MQRPGQPDARKTAQLIMHPHCDGKVIRTQVERIAQSTGFCQVRPVAAASASAIRGDETAEDRSSEQLVAMMYSASQLCEACDERGLRSALSLLKEVIRKSPSYPGVHAAMAHCHIDLFRRGAISHAEASRNTCAAVRAAVACDRRLGADTLCAIGAVACYIDWNLVLAEQRFRAALALRPSARRAELLAELLTMTGRFDEASFYLDIASQLDPYTVRHHFAALACAFYRREEPYNPLSSAGATETAARQWEAIMRGPMCKAAQHAATGEGVAALGCLTEAVALREPLFLFQQVDRRFDILRDAPEFVALDRTVKWRV